MIQGYRATRSTPGYSPTAPYGSVLKQTLMNKLNVKFETLPERCEICHQSDHFAPMTNHCSRCSSISASLSARLEENDGFPTEIRALQLLYFISGGAGLLLGYMTC